MCCKGCRAKFRAGVIPLESVASCQEINCHLPFFFVYMWKPDAFKIFSVNIFAKKKVAGSKVWTDSNSNTSLGNPYFVDESYKLWQYPVFLGVCCTILFFIDKFTCFAAGNVRGSWVAPQYLPVLLNVCVDYILNSVKILQWSRLNGLN